MGGDGLEHALQLPRVQRGPAVERDQRPVAAEGRRAIDLQVHVAGTRLDSAREEGVEIHPSLIGSLERLL